MKVRCIETCGYYTKSGVFSRIGKGVILSVKNSYVVDKLNAKVMSTESENFAIHFQFIEDEEESEEIKSKKKFVKECYNEVEHPSHYNVGSKEVIDIIEDATETFKGVNSFFIGNIIKYILRYPFKGGAEDLEKAKFYLEKLIEKAKGDDE